MTTRRRNARRLLEALLATYGAAGVLRRTRYELELRAGVLRRRTPPGWDLRNAPPGGVRLPSFPIEDLRHAYGTLPQAAAIRAQIVRDADRLLSGQLRLFGGDDTEVGWPPAWRRNPETGHEHPRGLHWTAVSDHDAATGDIKYVWESSRFSWAFLLARAFVVSGESRCADAFWRALEDWATENPPYCGPNWRCAQESSVRGAALLFALRCFREDDSATPQRLRLADQLLYATARRVAATIHYAASQRNNHLLSEAVFLSVVAVSYPAWPEAARWGRLGWRHVRAGIADQFYPDGTYAQHSFTYQRFAVETLCWLIVVRRSLGLTPPREVLQAVRRSVRTLHAVQDERSGKLPNLGANDGAMLLQLSTCDYRDFRPALQTASLLLDEGRLYETGPWDEQGVWVAGPKALDAPPAGGERPERLVSKHGGLLLSRGSRCMAMLRLAPTWRHRPSQADDLHVDIWLDGCEVAADPGTYRYTAPPPWNNGLAASRVHNTATIDGGDRLRRLGRFLSVQWPASRVLLDAAGEDWQLWVVTSEVPVWESLGGEHRRLLLRYRNCVIVGDLVRADPPHRAWLRWNLPAGAEPGEAGSGYRLAGGSWSVELLGPPGTTYREVTDGLGPEGWQSPTYGQLRARRTVTLVCPAGGQSIVFSVFAFAGLVFDPAGLEEHVRALLLEATDERAADLVTFVQRFPGCT